MQWILVGLLVQASQLYTKPIAVHESLDDCMAHREYVVQNIGRPIINYQVICVATDRVDI